MVLGKVYLGPCAERSKDWERMVTAGRLAVHQHTRQICWWPLRLRNKRELNPQREKKTICSKDMN